MSPSSAPPLVEMRNVSKAFGGVQAVDDVSLIVRPGEVVGLLGHNGAGKSTLVKILAGAQGFDTGSILVNGQEARIASPTDAKALGIETIYQTLALADNLDAPSNLFLGREIRKLGYFMDRRAMLRETEAVCRQINPRFTNLTVPVRSLSGGQRQSIAIARAVYFKAKVIIMDEPTAALGPGETRQVKDLVMQLKAAGVGIVLISHDMEDVFDLSDRLVIMQGGRVVGRLETSSATREEVLSLIIMGDGLSRSQKPAG